jgi:hypothetical protein
VDFIGDGAPGVDDAQPVLADLQLTLAEQQRAAANRHQEEEHAGADPHGRLAHQRKSRPQAADGDQRRHDGAADD